MENTRRKQRKSPPTTSTYISALFISALFSIAGRAIYSHILGETGMGYYAAVYELFLFILIFTGFFLPEAEAKSVRARMAKGQINNAGKVLKCALLYGVITGIIFALICAGLSGFISQKLLLEPLCSLALFCISPAIFFASMAGAYRGYFEGIGSAVPTLISKILEQIFSLGFGLIFTGIFFNYGEKVGHLVQNSNYAAAYGVAGMAVGISAAQILILFFLIFISRTFKASFRRQPSQDNSKVPDTYPQILLSFFSDGLPHLLMLLFTQGSVFISMLLYVHYTSAHTTQNFAFQYGSFYAKFALVTGVFVCLLCLQTGKPLSAIRHQYGRGEQRGVRDIFFLALNSLCVYGVGLAFLLCTLAEPITKMLFGNMAGTIFLFQTCSFLLLLIPCGIFFQLTLCSLGKQLLALKNAAIAFVVYIFSLVILLNVVHAGIASIAYGYMILFGLLTILNGMSLFRFLKFTPDFIRILALPALSGAICSMLAMLLSRALLEPAGALVTSLVCFILGFAGYFILLMALKSLGKRELSKMPFGGIWLKVGQILHLL